MNIHDKNTQKALFLFLNTAFNISHFITTLKNTRYLSLIYFILNNIKIIQFSKCVIIGILVSYKVYKAFESNCNNFLEQVISQQNVFVL